MIGDHLVERKGLKQVERKGLKEGIKVTHRRQAPTLGRSDLSPRTILDTHVK